MNGHMGQESKEKPPQSTIFGTVLMAAGTAVFLLWMGDIMGIFPLAKDLPVAVTVSMTVFGLGVGWMLVRGEGDSIGDAAMSWFKRRGGSGGE